MINDQHTLNRRLIYSAQQLNTIENLNLSKKINCHDAIKDENSDPTKDLEDNCVFILGYN